MQKNIKTLSQICNVGEQAIEFWNLLFFLCPSIVEAEDILKDCRYARRNEVETLLYNKRYECLTENKYANSTEFLYFYSINKKKALERLFQQPLNECMLSNFNGDPEQLYLIHSKKPKSWFMECLLYM